MNTGSLGFPEVIEDAPELQCPDCSDCGCLWLSHNLERGILFGASV